MAYFNNTSKINLQNISQKNLDYFLTTPPEKRTRTLSEALKQSHGIERVLQTDPSARDYLRTLLNKVISNLNEAKVVGEIKFDAFESELIFIDRQSRQALTHKIGANNIQWLMCKEVYEAAPDRCTFANLSNAYEARNYFGKDKLDADEYKLFLNAKRRLNNVSLLHFGARDMITVSGRDFSWNPAYSPK